MELRNYLHSQSLQDAEAVA